MSSLFPPDAWIAPGHFDIKNWIAFDGLSADQEFDLIAPVAIYFCTDLAYKAEASKALTKLKRLKHPLAQNGTVAEILNTTRTPNGLVDRYNGLVMAIADDEVPGIASHIDAWGAYAFSQDGDNCVLSGDENGMFAYYMNAKILRERFN